MKYFSFFILISSITIHAMEIDNDSNKKREFSIETKKRS
jgi:hypothetical protein